MTSKSTPRAGGTSRNERTGVPVWMTRGGLATAAFAETYRVEQRLFAAGADHDAGAMRGEHDRGGSTDATTGADDDHDGVTEGAGLHHVFLARTCNAFPATWDSTPIARPGTCIRVEHLATSR